MEKTIEFITGKKLNDVVNPHTKLTKGYPLCVGDLVRLLTPRAWLNRTIIQNYISLLVDYLRDILVLEPDILIGFNRNEAKLLNVGTNVILLKITTML